MYVPYIGSIPKGRSTYSTTRGARVKGTGGGEISAIGQIYIQRVKYGSAGSRAWSQGWGCTGIERKRGVKGMGKGEKISGGLPYS